MAEEIAAADPKTLEQLDSNYRSACAEYGKAFSGVQKVSQAAKSLKAESRQVSHIYLNPGVPFLSGCPLMSRETGLNPHCRQRLFEHT